MRLKQTNMASLQGRLFLVSRILLNKAGQSTFSTSRVLQQNSQAEPLTLCSQDHGIRIITLNNPEKRNALSLAMLESLDHNLSSDIEDDLRVIILRGKGPVFSAGHDLSEMTSHKGNKSAQAHMAVFQKCTEVMTKIQDIHVPVIAEVNGLATAAGCQLVATCDMAVAANEASFATPGVSVGLFCSTPGIALARSVPRKIALQMLLTGKPITAQEALLHGLVNRVVSQDKLKEEVMRMALNICESSGSVIGRGKEFFNKQIGMDRVRAYKNGEVAMVENLRMVDAQEGIEAFLKKRKPKWTHTEELEH